MHDQEYSTGVSKNMLIKMHAFKVARNACCLSIITIMDALEANITALTLSGADSVTSHHSNNFHNYIRSSSKVRASRMWSYTTWF